jgi:hypothetical protein
VESDSEGVEDVKGRDLCCFEGAGWAWLLFMLVLDTPFPFAFEPLGRGGEKAGRLRFVAAEAWLDGMSNLV